MGRDRSRWALLASAVLTVALTVAGPAPVVSGTSTSAAEDRPLLELRAVPGSDVRSLDVPLTDSLDRARGGAVTTGPIGTSGFSLVGFTWRGAWDPHLQVRTLSRRGWSRWQAVPRLHDVPDTGTEGIAGQRASQPWWVGRSTGIDVRVTAGVRDLTMALIDPGTHPTDRSARRAANVGKPNAEEPDAAPRPYIRSRKSWGAKERWRNGGPYYNRTIKQVHVHHTATGNDYRGKDVPALLRAIYRYHTHNLGWSDIGYNFLVDRFGRNWQGRAGGSARPVRGAHTLGFNDTSTGVAVLGTYTDKSPNEKVLKALVHLAAWKLDRYHRKPKGKVTVYSRGSDKYPAGTKVRLRVIDGHRDTNDTECPGGLLYDELTAIRLRTQNRVDRFDPPAS